MRCFGQALCHKPASNCSHIHIQNHRQINEMVSSFQVLTKRWVVEPNPI
jgi:hypothetical protein